MPVPALNRFSKIAAAALVVIAGSCVLHNGLAPKQATAVAGTKTIVPALNNVLLLSGTALI